MDRVKEIVDVGLFQGWSRDNIISQIEFEIASKEELELLYVWSDNPQLNDRAEYLFEKYRKEYYETLKE